MRATHGGEFDVTNRGLLGRRKVVEAKDFCVVIRVPVFGVWEGMMMMMW